MAGISEEFIQRLKSSANLPQIAAGYVGDLKRQGATWKGCCPFHKEKTPSFCIYPQNTFHCFGCGAHGDAVSFIMELRNLSFPDAVKELASSLGMQVPEETAEQSRASKQRADVKSVVAAAAAFYERLLWQPEARGARDYLASRGLTDETIRSFGLGWGGSERGRLSAELAKQNFTEADLLASGVMAQTDAKRDPYEVFRNRITIPIKARDGTAISFGGRILPDGTGPKYLNGPETVIFSKRNVVFNLDRAAVDRAPPVVVEGYLDVISLAQAGIGTAVAPLGTALTIEQLEAIWGIHSSPVLCFDGDNAGRNAAAKALLSGLKGITADRAFRVAVLPEGEDPDSFIRGHGSEALLAVLAQAEQYASALYRTVKTRIFSDELKSRSHPSNALPAGYTKGSYDFEEAGPAGRQRLRLALEAHANQVNSPVLAVELHSTLLRMAVEDQRAEMRLRAAHEVGPVSGGLPVASGASDLPAALANRSQVLISMVLKWPRLAFQFEELLSILPVAKTVSPLRDAILDWARSYKGSSSESLQAMLDARGLALAANAAMTWAKESPAMGPISEPDAIAVFWQLLRQGRPQYEAWAKQAQSPLALGGLSDEVAAIRFPSHDALLPAHSGASVAPPARSREILRSPEI
jgi:DNA primase